MKTLYLDCGMGAAGDMLAAALYELLDEEEQKKFIETMNNLAPDEVQVSVRPETKCGILGTHFDVTVNGEEERSHDHHEHEHHHHDHDHDHDYEHEHMHHHHDHCHEHVHEDGTVHTHEHEHHHHYHDHMHEHHHHGHSHHSMADVENMISGFAGVSDAAIQNAIDVYKLIAAAESAAHGRDVSEIHFHEVGMMDAVVDVTAVCVLMDMLDPEEVYASPVRVGKGHMRCAHGVLPVPAPATAYVLRGVPTYAGNIQAELCTPTGAALLKHFVKEFREQPLMTVDRIGYGMGTKDFDICNCVRALYQAD